MPSHWWTSPGRVVLLDNPRRVQSASINLAVARFGTGREWLVRIEAHALYPEDYCEVLIDEAKTTGAAAAAVAMHAVGDGPAQAAIAQAQNSQFGNGGAAHRTAPGATGSITDIMR